MSFNGLTNPVTVFVLSVAFVAELLTSWMRWRFDRFRSHDCYCKIMSCSYKKHALLDAVGHCGSSQCARSPVDASDWSRSTTAFRSNTTSFYCRDQMKVPWCKYRLSVSSTLGVSLLLELTSSPMKRMFLWLCPIPQLHCPSTWLNALQNVQFHALSK